MEDALLVSVVIGKVFLLQYQAIVNLRISAMYTDQETAFFAFVGIGSPHPHAPSASQPAQQK
jgi:hypothetical protein